VCITIISLLLLGYVVAFADDLGTEYNARRTITIDLNGGYLSPSLMKWMYKYDKTPPSGADPNVFYEGVATGLVHDKHGNVHTLGRTRREEVRSYPWNTYPFYDNENPRAGSFIQHMDFVGQTPWIWLGNPTRPGYSFAGWETNRTQIPYNGGTLIHAGYYPLPFGDFTIRAKWVDVTPPEIYTRNHEDTADFHYRGWANTDVTIRLKFWDSGSGYRQSRYAWSTSTAKPSSGWSDWTTSSNYTVTQTNSGSWYLHIEAYDNDWNYSYLCKGPYQIDKTPPSHVSHLISGHRYTNGSTYWARPYDTLKIKLKGYDGDSGISCTAILLSGSGVSCGGYHEWFGSADNIHTSDWSAPDVAFVSASRTYDSGGYREVEIGVQPKTNGHIYSLLAGYYDFVWNYSNWVDTSCKIGVDGVAPSVTITPNSRSLTNQNITVTISASDSGSGVKRIEYMISTDGGATWPGSWTQVSASSTTVTLSNTGQYKIRARAVDNVDNVSGEVYSGVYQIDKIAPTVSANPTTRDWNNTNVTVMLTYNDTGGSGLSAQQYAWSTSTATPSTWNNYSGAVTQSSEGIWYLHVRAVDAAGNTTTTYFGPYKIDKTRPAVTANPSTREWGNTGVTVTLTYSDSGGSGLATRQYAWSTSTATPSTWTNYTSPVTQSGEGMWYLHVRAVDAAGNVYTAYFGPYKIDRTPPTVSANPSSREWGDTPVTVALTFSDTGGSGIKDRLYAWSTNTATPTEWNNYESPVTQATPGIWYLHVKVTDTAGNVTTTYFGPYTIDELKYIEVIPSAVTIVRTETLQLTVKAVYHLKTEDVTTSAQYSSSNDSIVTVSPNGTITGRAVGQAVITATYKSKQAQCTVTVQEPEKTVAGTITITKTPTYVFTRWNKTADGQPSRMDITISWDNLNLLILRADKTVLRSEPITVTRAESQHRINRYTIPETYSWGTLTYSKLTNYSAGSGSYRAVYEYDKAGKPNSPFTFTGYYTYEGEEKSFSVTVYIPVNGIATTLLRPSIVPLSLGFQPALTNSGNNTWKYSGVWPASGVLTLDGSAGDLAWPVPGSTVISSYFGRRVDPIDGVVRMHYGIDIPAPEGTNIVAPDDGKVVYVGYDEGFGNMLVIRSGIYDFVFGHCSNILVSNGQTVSKGQAIAKVGSTGRATGPHLDFRVTLGPYTQGNYIDPLTVVKP